MTQISLQTHLVARNLVWLSFREIMIRLLGLATAIYLARRLGPGDFGALNIAFAAVGLLSVLVMAGTHVRATRLTAIDATRIPQTFGLVGGIRVTQALILFAVLAVCAPVFSRYLGVPSLLLVLAGICLLRPALSVEWAFQGRDRMQTVAMAEVVEKVALLAGLLVLVRGSANDLLRVPVVEAAAAMLFVGLLYWRLAREFGALRIRFEFSEWPSFLRESAPIGVASLMGALQLHTGVLLLGLFVTADAAGAFLVAQKIALTAMTLMVVVNTSVFPTVSRLMVKRTREALELQTNLLRHFLGAAIPLFLLAGFFARQVLAALFGDAYVAAAPALVVLLFALPFTLFGMVLQNVLLAAARPRAVFLGKTCGATVLVAVSAWLIPGMETLGAALGIVTGELAGMLVLMAGARFAFRAIPWSAAAAATLAAGLVMAAALAVTAEWDAAARIALALALYIGSIFLFGGLRAEELGNVSRLLAALLRRE